MLIAHLPASYLLTRFLLKNSGYDVTRQRWFMACGIAAGLLPDLDMLYFYLVDMRQHHHHTYWSHLPMFWLTAATVSALLPISLRRNHAFQVWGIVFGNILLHLILDTFVGDIWWFSPWINRPYALFEVPAAHGHWVWNFVLHWSFAVELFIVAAAGGVFFRTRESFAPATH